MRSKEGAKRNIVTKKRGAFFAIMILVVGLISIFASTQSSKADVPLAARLLAEPYGSTGVRVNLSGLGGNMRGLANDGTTIYVMNTSGNVMTASLGAINMTPAQAPQSLSGTMHTVGWGSNGAPSLPSINQLSMSYSHGCLWMTDSSNSPTDSKLYCIDVSDWSVTEVSVPSGKLLPIGYYFTFSNMIDFPDGRIGKVSGYTKQSDYYFTSTLRTYTVTGTGRDATIAWSHDYVMKDTDTVYNDSAGWARDEHGIATDGTYLYRIQWNSVSPNTKVWALTGDGTEATTVFGGSYTMPYANMHYLSHNHTANNYIVGYFDGASLFITTAADPGPGPGNPLTPTFAASHSVSHGYTVQVTNYDNNYEWSVVSSAGTATISASGLVTVTGLTPGQSATITVTTTKPGMPDGSAGTSGAALGVDSNGDGVADVDQDDVVSATNSTTGKTIAVSAESSAGSCDFGSFAVKQPGDLVVDDSYKYPLGLVGFTATCGTAGFTATIKQYYYDPPAGDFVLRKYVNNAYQTVGGATLERTTIDGANVLVITYDVTDGGVLDDDGIANGVVVDPAGPALLTESTVPGAPNTGIAPIISRVVFSGWLIGLGLALALVITTMSVRNQRR